MRPGPHRPPLRLPEILDAPGYSRGGQTSSRRLAARRHHRERKIRIRIRPRTARHHVRRRSAHLRRRPGIPEHHRRLKPALEHSRARRRAAPGHRETRRQVRFHPRGARRRPDPRHRSCDRRSRDRHRSPARRPAHQLHPRSYPAPAAALHNQEQRQRRISQQARKDPETSSKIQHDPKRSSESAAHCSGCREVKVKMNTTAAAAPASVTLTNDLLTGMEWAPAQVRSFLHLAADVKAHPDRYRGALAGRFFALIFEKPSLRTRVTFEVGIASLGGSSVFLDHTVTHLGERESIPDVAKSLERWVTGIVARVFKQESLDQLAANAGVPVINALSDRYHPCQAFADFFTLEERFGNLRGLKVAYVGDGNNTCHSLLSIGARTGAHVRVATPARPRTCASPLRRPTSGTRVSPPKPSASSAKRAAKSKSCARPPKQSQARKPSTPTPGPAWARNRKPPRAPPLLPGIKSTMLCSPTPRPTRSSCTVFRPTAARKSAKPSWIRRAPSFSSKPKIACTCRKRFC